MADPIMRAVATEIVPQLEKAIDALMGGGQDKDDCAEVLWDNKVGILRVLQSVAAPYCSEGDRCVCGGDTPEVRAGCSNWIK